MKLHITRLSICTVALVAMGCAGDKLAYNLPPAQRLLEPGPGVGGPGPGVLPPGGGALGVSSGGRPGLPPAMGGGGCVPVSYHQQSGLGGDGVMQAQCLAGCPGGACMGGAGSTSQLAFLGVEGGEVTWDVSGQAMFDSPPLIMPGKQNFYQGAIYRLKLSNLPNRPGIELYPTIEVAPVTPRTDAYLAHAPIPIQFTDEDLDQVLSGNYVTKVIYLPDPEFQELALAGVETLVSTRLPPGTDPIAEADHRGSILAIVRIGNLDLQTPQQTGGGMVQPVQYMEGCPDGGCYSGDGYGAGMGMPQGMPAAGFSPPASPPHMVSGVTGPQYGMPYVGTPIGLPGPPHVPLGHQAGLVSHTMKNRTKVLMPPPVHKMNISVKQRPGMNYPRPVNHVKIARNKPRWFPHVWRAARAGNADCNAEPWQQAWARTIAIRAMATVANSASKSTNKNKT